MLWLYNLILVPAVLVALPFAFLWAVRSPVRRAALLERFAPFPPMPPGTVWVHAASLGEVEAASPLLEALVHRGIPVIATALTSTGRGRLRARFPRLPMRIAPLDLPGLMDLSVRRSHVSVLVLIETEIWPNAIRAVTARGGRVVIASARLSDRSFPLYLRARPLFSAVLRLVDAVGAQSARDCDRFVRLGLPRERGRVTGDLKLDRPMSPEPAPGLRAALGEGPFLVGGSTHPGEEEALLGAWEQLRSGPAPSLRLLLVPRHVERAADAVDTARRMGVQAALRSSGRAADADVVVVDTVGELGALYRLSDLVFVGGSLAPIGGHNLVEPVRAGRVVVHGPHVENQREQQRLLEPLAVLHRVSDARELASTLAALWRDPARHAPAEVAAPVLDAHSGAVERNLALVLAQHADACEGGNARA